MFARIHPSSPVRRDIRDTPCHDRTARLQQREEGRNRDFEQFFRFSVFNRIHCGAKPGRFETSNHSLSHVLGSEGVTEYLTKEQDKKDDYLARTDGHTDEETDRWKNRQTDGLTKLLYNDI